MAERNIVRRNSTNTNENRIRLKVKDDPKYYRKQRIKAQKKRDKRFKIIVSLLTFALIVGMGYFNYQTRTNLSSKRTEYNQLMSDLISQELKRDRLKARLENSVDLNRIQRYAIEELGMVYANNDSKPTEANGN